MYETMITCDCCKKSSKQNAKDGMQLWAIKIMCGSNTPYQVDWCRECCIKASIFPAYNSEDKKIVPAQPPPTLEDLVRQIVQEELS